MGFRFLRVLISAVAAMAILAAPFPYAAGALDANPPHHSSKHLPRTHHRAPVVVKARVAVTALVRSSSRSAREPSLRVAKRLPSLSSCPFSPAPSPNSAGVRRVFRPLRC